MSTNEQVVYKLKHLPSGLYYSPQGCTVNTDKLGTVYNNKPARVRWVGFPYGVTPPDGFDSRYSKCELDDWVVEEYILTKKEDINTCVRQPLEKSEGVMMSIETFKEYVEDSFITEDDGFGIYSDGDLQFGKVDLSNIKEGYSYVVWYKK